MTLALGSPQRTLLNPLQVTSLVHGTSDRVPDPVEFVVSPRFLDRGNIYPRQLTFYKIIFLRDDLFSDYDLEVIGGWEETFRQTGNEGISPGVLERIRINKEQGRSWFREVLGVIGRRGGKGHVGALAGAYILWNFMHLPGGPQNYYGIDRDKRLTAMVFAGKKEQAVANQWRDLSNVITSGPCFGRYISKALGERLSVMAPTDLLRLQRQQLSGVDLESDPATFEILPSSSTLMAGRGPASFCQFYDEMAHIIATGSNRDASSLYASATPSLDQFGVDGFIYAGSSPWQMQGQYYDNWLKAIEMDEGDFPAYPEMLMLQLPSWGPYEDWEIAHTLPLVKPKRRWIDVHVDGKPEVMEVDAPTRKFRPLKRAIQAYDHQMKQLERANPETFAVERRSHWAAALDAYLNSQKVEDAYGAYRGQVLSMNRRGRLSVDYVAHGDPSKVGDNFGFAIGHAEPGDESTNGLPYVVFDVLKAWRPGDFEDNQIDYLIIQDNLEGYVRDFVPGILTFDQFNSVATIGALNRFVKTHGFPKHVSIYERTATRQSNWRENETFKAALNLGLIRLPKFNADGDFDEDAELARLELRFLEEKNGRVDHPSSGPVQTKDVADAIMAVTYHLIGEQMSAFLELEKVPLRGTAQGGTGTPVHDPASQLSGLTSRAVRAGSGGAARGRAPQRGMRRR